MKIFLDTEFTGLHQNTTLISIGLISEDGRTFYTELTDYDEDQIDDWLTNNVINKLKFLDKTNYQKITESKHTINLHETYHGYSIELKCNQNILKEELRLWFQQFSVFGKNKIWSDCLAYDWVLFNEIFGHAFNIPNEVYYIPFDICTVFEMKGINPDISRTSFASMVSNEEHNALYDAKVIKACYERLENA